MDFEKLLELMCTKKASDLFITAERPPALKVDGKIIDVSINFTIRRAILKAS